MPVTRHFLDWKEPALPAAADWLVARYARDGELDLSRVIVVVPGGRVRRRLEELLVARADARSLVLTPPTITTEHGLPELLYEPQRPFASQLTQQLAWAEALEQTPPARRRHFLPHPPAAGDTARWLELGDLLRRLHVELAADGLDFQSVLAAGQQLEDFAEHDRWRTLADIQARYLRRLDELGLWDIQTARLVAVRQREPQTDRDIVLVGMVDLNRAQRQLVDLAAERNATEGVPYSVTALVVAPSKLADRFDEHGCLVVAKWLEAEIPLRDEQMLLADGPADQAESVSEWLAARGGKYRADEVVVGLPDGRLAPQLARQLAQCGVASRWYEARKVGETGPFRLLQLAADLGERRRFSDLAAAVRHPDVFDWLLPKLQAASVHDPLSVLDQFATEKIPASLDAQRLENDEQLAAMRTIFAAVEALRSSLPARPQPLARWADSLRKLLLEVYGGRTLDRSVPAERLTILALQMIDECLAELDKLPAELMPTVTLADAFQLALAPAAGEVIPPAAEPGVVEMLGWLELPLDDAPALVVTTFNDGLVPKASGTEMFLPNRLRQQLGLLDNDRRYARDAYATSVLVHSRPDFGIVVARRDSEGNPLAPSRLVFATGDEAVARRALKLFGDPPPSRPRRGLLVSGQQPRAKSALPIFQPPSAAANQPPLESISVTAFKSYLACPYRYYLRHVLRLEPLADSLTELDPAAFGTLLHDVLQRFGRADDARHMRLTGNAEEIREYLGDWLDTLAAARLGLKHCRPAVAVQIEQARLRLAGLAEWQARRNAGGWQIVHGEDTERQLAVEFRLSDGSAVRLRGRIDRIDYHAASGTLAILDYKTAESGLDPDRTHLARGEWIDLQLPLYRHLVRGTKLPLQLDKCRITLGYILLPKDVRAIGEEMARWSDEELLRADEVAREVLGKIRAGIFWPPTSPPPDFSEDFALLTQDNALGGWALGGLLAAEGDVP
jgi:hypothetical protein